MCLMCLLYIILHEIVRVVGINNENPMCLMKRSTRSIRFSFKARLLLSETGHSQPPRRARRCGRKTRADWSDMMSFTGNSTRAERSLVDGVKARARTVYRPTYDNNRHLSRPTLRKVMRKIND